MENLEQIATELKNGDTILYLGMNIFARSSFEDGTPVPFDSDSLILALNNSRPMAPKLMYEYSRAAMNIEQRDGRKALEQKLIGIFSKKFSTVAAHELVRKIHPRYVVDTNYDDTLLSIYADTSHSVILGKARLGAEHDRFEIFEYNLDEKRYTKVAKEQINLDNPIIFKPMGSHNPAQTHIISDADFVDWITEAMGGFALPPALKQFRVGKKYLFLGLAFDKDTQRMVANEITLDLAGGYFVHDGAMTKNGVNFLTSHKMEQITEDPNLFAKKLLEIF